MKLYQPFGTWGENPKSIIEWIVLIATILLLIVVSVIFMQNRIV